MRENCLSGSEGGGAQANGLSLPLSQLTVTSDDFGRGSHAHEDVGMAVRLQVYQAREVQVLFR
jgi:hypothetical protein